MNCCHFPDLDAIVRTLEEKTDEFNHLWPRQRQAIGISSRILRRRDRWLRSKDTHIGSRQSSGLPEDTPEAHESTCG